MRVLFFLVHPAHYYFFKHVMRGLEARGHEVQVVIKQKDILETLLDHEDVPYENLQPNSRPRKSGRFSIARASLLDLLDRDRELFRLVRRRRPDVMIGSETSIAHVGRVLGIPSIVTTEDDFAVQKEFCYPTFPFADAVVAPDVCDLGPWERRKVGYPGYHKLAYLHPAYFQPDESVVRAFHPAGRPYFVLRFVSLTAHHDIGVKGLSGDLADRLVALLEPHGDVYITSEGPLAPNLERHRLRVAPNLIHHVLYHADLLVGDSQSMAVEAAMLGTPSIRFSGFAGRISVLEELEHTYGLTFGVPPDRPDRLLELVSELVGQMDLKREWAARRVRMLRDKIDVSAFLIWLIEEYPGSARAVRGDRAVLDRFRAPLPEPAGIA